MSISTGKRGIIVIDSETYPGVTCCNWEDQFPNIAEFEAIILNMTLVSEETLDLTKWQSLKFMLGNLRKSNGRVYFIINENHYLTWDSFYPEIIHEEGETIESNSPELDPYFALLHKWNFIFTGFRSGGRSAGFNPLCKNSYGKALAIKSGKNYYLPRPSKHSIQEGIEILLRDVLKIQPEKTVKPEWINQISIPGESQTIDSIKTIDKKLMSLQEEKSQFIIKLEENNKLKSILYETGDHLENALTKVFRTLNINVDNTSDQKKADLLINTINNEVILVEVKGVKGTLARSHLRQLHDWITEYWEEHGIEPKGLVLINPFRLDSPAERKDYYPDDCIKLAESRNICLMTTCDLFKILTEFINKNISPEEIEREIIETNGVWDK